MTINELAKRLEREIADYDSLKRKYGLVVHIKDNIDLMKNQESYSLNRTWEDMNKSADPVKLRLYQMNGYIGRPLIGKMLRRTMTEEEYTMVLTGTDRKIISYVIEMYRQETLNPELEVWQRNQAAKEYMHVAKMLRQGVVETLSRIFRAA